MAKEKGWSNPELAINGGVQHIYNNYIKYGQNTVYFQKFDVNYAYNASGLFGMQYMTNITAPISESNIAYNAYNDSQTINSAFEFVIPVYDNMPYAKSINPDFEYVATPIYLDDKSSGEPDVINIRAKPDGASAIIGTATETKAFIVEKTKFYRIELGYNGWDKIRFSSGLEGYVSKEFVHEYIRPTGITLNKSASKLDLSAQDTLIATISPSATSEKKVTWHTDNEGIATVDSNGKVTPHSAGTVNIAAKTVDGGLIAACKYTVAKFVTGVSLNKTVSTLKVGQTEMLTANILPTNATNKNVTWHSDNSGIASVDSNGKVTANRAGTVNIAAKTIDGGLIAVCKYTITNFVTGVSLNKTNIILKVGQTETLIANVLPTEAIIKSVTWHSDNSGIASVDATGKVTAYKAGTVNIAAKTVEGGLIVVCKVTVSIPVSEIKFNKTNSSLKVGQTETLTVNILPSNAVDKNVTWHTDNEGIATVDATGKVTAHRAGIVNIAAKTADGTNKLAVCKYIITNFVTGISLNKTDEKLNIDETLTLIPTISPTDAIIKNVTWHTDNEGIATVDSNGKVTAHKPGIVYIAAKTVDGGKLGICKFTVRNFVTGISLNKTISYLKVGQTETLLANILPTNSTNKNVTWHSDNSGVASVDATGKVIANRAGTVYIAAKTVEGGLIAVCKYTIINFVTGVSLNKTNIILKSGQTETLIATISPTEAIKKDVTWHSDNSGVASVDSTGKVTAYKSGTANIVAKTVDGGIISWPPCKVTVPIPVTSVTLNKTSVNLKVGQTETLLANIFPTNAGIKDVTWHSDNSGIVSVDTTGKITAISPGTVYIAAKSVDGGKISWPPCKVTVTKFVTSVTLNKTTSALKVGQTETLIATVLPTEAIIKGVTWHSDNSGVASVDATGKVTAISPGVVNIAAKSIDGGIISWPPCKYTITL